MPSPGLTIFGMAGNYAARRSGIVRGRTVGTQQIAFAAASNGERAPNLARIGQEWPSLVAIHGVMPNSSRPARSQSSAARACRTGSADEPCAAHHRAAAPCNAATSPGLVRRSSSCSRPANRWW